MRQDSNQQIGRETLPEPVRVLVVDDSPFARETLCKFLRAQRLEVVAIANNGQEALEMTARFRPELVVMDVQMPVMNGLEASGRIMAAYPGTKVILTSIQDSPELRQACREHGARAFIPKIHFAQQFAAALTAVL